MHASAIRRILLRILWRIIRDMTWTFGPRESIVRPTTGEEQSKRFTVRNGRRIRWTRAAALGFSREALTGSIAGGGRDRANSGEIFTAEDGLASRSHEDHYKRLSSAVHGAVLTG